MQNQLQEVPYLQLKYDELKRELEDSKFKVDQLPGLLSEQARLRGYLLFIRYRYRLDRLVH